MVGKAPKNKSQIANKFKITNPKLRNDFEDRRDENWTPLLMVWRKH
jgi:hypothetical protein